MGEARNAHSAGATLFTWPMPPVGGNPLVAVVTDINGKLLEGVASVQKDWAEFVHQRVQEDIAASRRLMNCQSLADMQQIYSQYLQTAFQQFRKESERALESGKSMTDAVVQSMESRDGEAMQRSQY